MAFVFKGAGAQQQEANTHAARVSLQSQPVQLPTLPASAFAGGVHPDSIQPVGEMRPAAQRNRVGVASLPDVKLFFDQKLYNEEKVEPVVLPAMQRLGTHTQRLKRVPSLSQRPKWGVKEMGEFARAEIAHKEQLVENLVGVPITREALRQTPASRLKHVLRPGFAEHGARVVAMAREAEKAQDRAYLYYSSVRQDQTRQKQRALREQHKLSTLQQPVPKAMATLSERRANAKWEAEWRDSIAEGAMDVEHSLELFERTKVPTVAARSSRDGRKKGPAAGAAGTRARPSAIEEGSEEAEEGKQQARQIKVALAQRRSKEREERKRQQEQELLAALPQPADENTRERRRQGEATLHHTTWLQQTGRTSIGRRAAKAGRATRVAPFEEEQPVAAPPPPVRQTPVPADEMPMHLPPAAAAEVAAATAAAMETARLEMQMEVEMPAPSLEVVSFT